MKQYRFDYIKDSVDKLEPNIPRTLELIEGLIPFGLLQYQRMTDPYGDIVENFEDWYKQRHEYCIKLVEEYKNGR